MTTREAVVNKMLSGSELKDLIRADVERVLEGEGMLSPHIAYGRIAYTVILQLHTDNPMRPESETRIHSTKRSDQPLVDAPPLLSPSPEAVAIGTRVDRSITSPNEERLRAGLSLPVVVRGQDGTVQTEQVKYPPQPELGPGNVTVTDVSKETREAWKVPAPTT